MTADTLGSVTLSDLDEALRAIEAKVGPIDAGAPGQEKYETCTPRRMVASCTHASLLHKQLPTGS